MESVAFVNGRILTGRREVEALLLEEGRVAVAGTRAQVERARPTGTATQDLHGRLVVPGLVDPHVHVADLLLARTGVDLAGVRSPEELVARVRAVAERGGVGPIAGRGWDQERFPGRRYPRAADLDRASRDRPIVLFRRCDHVAVVNSAALAEIGVDERTPDPPGGRIGRAPDRRPNGLLFDRAIDPVRPMVVPRLAGREREIVALLEEATACGITALGAMSCRPDDIATFRRMAERHPGLPRVRPYLRWDEVDDFAKWAPRPGRDAPEVAGVKIVADGSFGARTAWLAEPYSDAPQESGFPLVAPEELQSTISAADSAGLPIAIHAIGDRALAVALAAIANAAPTQRPRIEHASLVPPYLREDLVRRRPILVVQPRFPLSDWWIEERLGPERARHAYPFRTLVEAGHLVAGSSDAPIEPLDPWTGIAAAVDRSRGPEALSPPQALALYTTGAAAALSLAGGGALEPGAPADLVILGASDLAAAAAAGRGGVAATWQAGECRYRAEGRAASR